MNLFLYISTKLLYVCKLSGFKQSLAAWHGFVLRLFFRFNDTRKLPVSIGIIKCDKFSGRISVHVTNHKSFECLFCNQLMFQSTQVKLLLHGFKMSRRSINPLCVVYF